MLQIWWMIWETGITIHVSAESQRFPKVRQMLGKWNKQWGRTIWRRQALTEAPSFLHKCVDYVNPTRLKERWLEHFLRQWPNWKVTSCHFPYPWGGIPYWLPVNRDVYVESQASKQILPARVIGLYVGV